MAGFGLAAVGLGLLMYGISEGPFHGWGSAPIVGAPSRSATVLLAVLVAVELHLAHPIIDIRLFSDRLFRNCNVVLGLGSAAFIGTLFLVALFFQDGFGLSALQSGLNTFPEALGVMAGAQVVTRLLYPVFGPRRIVVAGLLVVALVLVVMSLVTPGTGLWLVRLMMLGLGLGVAAVFHCSQTASMAAVDRAGGSGGRPQCLRRRASGCGGAIEVALLTTVLAAAGRAVGLGSGAGSGGAGPVGLGGWRRWVPGRGGGGGAGGRGGLDHPRRGRRRDHGAAAAAGAGRAGGSGRRCSGSR